MVGRLTRRLLSVWAENVQGEIWPRGWREGYDREKRLCCVTHLTTGEFQRGFRCSKCRHGVSLVDKGMTGVCLVGSVRGHHSYPQWCGQKNQDKISQASCWGLSRGERMYPIISLSHYHCCLKLSEGSPLLLGQRLFFSVVHKIGVTPASHTILPLCRHHTSFLSVPSMGHGHHCISNTSKYVLHKLMLLQPQDLCTCHLPIHP